MYLGGTASKGQILCLKKRFIPISIGAGEYNVPQSYIFVENSLTAIDFKKKFCDFYYFFMVNKVLQKFFPKHFSLVRNDSLAKSL